MKLQALKYLVALAKEKHFGRAADICCVSQPTLSIAIHNLEKQLEVIIFERIRHNILITPIGEKIIAQARVVLDAVEQINHLVSYEKKAQEMPIMIGIIFTMASYVLPGFITKWHEKHPNTPLITEENYTHLLIESLLDGRLDVGLIATPVHSKYLVQKPLFSDDLLWVLPKQHKLAKQSSLNPDDISGERVILLGEAHCLRQHVIDNCPGCIQDPQNIISQGTSVETIKQMVASGYGISILPRSTLKGFGYEGLIKTLPFRSTKPFVTVYLTWRVTFPRHQWIDAILNIMKK